MKMFVIHETREQISCKTERKAITHDSPFSVNFAQNLMFKT